MDHEQADIDSIEKWLVDAAEGRADPAETDRVRLLLTNSPVLRRHVALRLLDESLLGEELQIAEAEGLLGDHLVQPSLVRPDRTMRRPRRRTVGYALAACVALVVVGWLVGRLTSQRPDVLPVPPSDENLAVAPAEAAGFAVLTQAIDVEWAPGTPPVRIGERITGQPLRIAAGFLQIEFFGGATAVVEGPADLDVVSDARIHFRTGKVRITVPPQAVGLSLNTGELELVDLGTEYAVRVGPDGAGEVHVLSGKVDVRRAKGESLRVVESGTAVVFTPQGNVKSTAAGGSGFVGVEKLKALRSTSEAAGLRRWRVHSQRWSDDPTLAMYFTFDGQNDFERQLTGRVPDRTAAADGAIVGCRWATGRFEGKGALEFMGTGDRVKVRVGGEFTSLSLFVSLRVGGFDRRYSSLLLADGYAGGKVHWQLTDKGSLRFSVGGSGAFEAPGVIRPGSLGKWVQLATVYDHKAGTVTHYVDGEPVASGAYSGVTPLTLGSAEIGNWNPQNASNNTIRSLNGTVDELAVFRRALSGAEIRQAYLAGKP